jgi:C1A family cysteine protease
MRKRLTVLLFAGLLAAGLGMPVALSQTPKSPAAPQTAASKFPVKFDLRDVDAVTPVKSQQGGTCWTHGTMASVESHLLLSGTWKKMGFTGIPMLAEYHLDWYNGFNKKFNDDLGENPDGKYGMTPHQGGDYKVACAYMSRGDGVVVIPEPDKTGEVPNKAWYKDPPKKNDPAYKKLYVRDVEWFTMDKDCNGIELIKEQIMKYGGMGTCYKSNGANLSKENIHYQPIDSNGDPNHSVCIVGWDDNKITAEEGAKKPPKAGAWLIKNSWGTKRGDKGYYWISYYDKHSARHPEMGAVTFRNVEPLAYDHVYYYDTHGWRDALEKVDKAFNAYTATKRETVKAVSFFTMKHDTSYVLKIYNKFEGGKLSGEVVSQTGTIGHTGFHTIDLMAPVSLKENDKFYVMVQLSQGGHAIDRTSNIPVLLGDDEQPPAKAEQPPAKVDPKVEPKKEEPKAKGKGGKGGGGGGKPIVISKANPGESFYWNGTAWMDLQEYHFEVLPAWATTANVAFDKSANFCIKALAVSAQ